MRFLLSIHDVWPGNFPLVSGYMQRLRSLGAGRIALLVVPAFHGGAPMDGCPEFLAWLRGESANGTELFLHGYYHWMAELAEKASGGGSHEGRSAWGRFVNRKLVAQEAEFSGISDREAARLLEMGLSSWHRTGLPLAGFVAPTWHGSPPEGLMRGRGIPIWETRFRLRRFSDGATRFAPPLAWDLSSPSGEPRLFGGAAWLSAVQALPLMKVAIHPGDFEGPGTVKALEKVFAAGRNIGYADAFGPESPKSSVSGPSGNRTATPATRPP
ncbi:MAG: deacetylase [Fibrobacteres bacterium]|nr:deacetylase [Fibrobacterota bacterium]